MAGEGAFLVTIFLASGYGLFSFFKGNVSVVHFVNDKWVWIHTNPYSRATLYTYLACTLLSFSAATYNDGKKALLEHRKNNGNESEDFKVTLRGCKYNMGENFWDSIIFPWHLTANVFPYAVMWMNPRKKVKVEQEQEEYEEVKED